MKLEGKIYDFGDKPISKHLEALAEEVEEQASINGKDENLAECAAHLKTLSQACKEAAFSLRIMACEVESEEHEGAMTDDPEPSSRAETISEIAGLFGSEGDLNASVSDAASDAASDGEASQDWRVRSQIYNVTATSAKEAVEFYLDDVTDAKLGGRAFEVQNGDGPWRTVTIDDQGVLSEGDLTK